MFLWGADEAPGACQECGEEYCTTWSPWCCGGSGSWILVGNVDEPIFMQFDQFAHGDPATINIIKHLNLYWATVSFWTASWPLIFHSGRKWPHVQEVWVSRGGHELPPRQPVEVVELLGAKSLRPSRLPAGCHVESRWVEQHESFESLQLAGQQIPQKVFCIYLLYIYIYLCSRLIFRKDLFDALRKDQNVIS